MNIEKLDRIIYLLNAMLIELEEFSVEHEDWCNEEIGVIREQMESIKDNVWRLTN